MPEQRATDSIMRPRAGAIWPVFPQTDIPALIQTPEGVFMNPAKDGVKDFYLRGLGGNGNVFPVPLPAGGSTIVTMTAPAEENNRGDMEIVKLMAVARQDSDPTISRRFSVDFSQTSTNRLYTNGPICSNLMFGISQLPASLFETVMLETNTSLIMRVTNLEAFDASLYMVAWGRRLLDWGSGISREASLQESYGRRSHPYWLTFDTGPELTVPAGGAVEALMAIPGSGDFECWQWMDDSDADYNIEVVEGQSGRAMMDGPMPARIFFAGPTVAVAGMPFNQVRAASTPFNWTFTSLYKRGSRLKIKITGATVGSKIRLGAHGRLLYYDEVRNVPAAPTLQQTQQAPPVMSPLFRNMRGTNPGGGFAGFRGR